MVGLPIRADDTRELRPERNPPWTREELILALDLYFKLYPHGETSRHPSVGILSGVLRNLAMHTGRPNPERFRSRDSVHMKLNNFRGLDPLSGETGLSHGGRLDKEIWDEFVDDRARLAELADAIRAFAAAPPAVAVPAESADDDESYAAPEGRFLLRQHRARERSTSLVRKKKERALQRTGMLACEVCGFVFSEQYGELGAGFIECHHTVPISQLRPGQ